MSSANASSVAPSIIYLGLDVHKDSVTIAVLPEGASAPSRVDRYPNDFTKLRKIFDRHARQSTIRACYEASGAGYVLQRAMKEWGYHCDVIAPSLIPKRPGVKRKHDKYDASELARLYRAGELTPVRIPSEAEERVRDVVRCRETIQRDLMRTRHYILKFLARHGFIYRETKNWTVKHHRWLNHLAGERSSLAPDVLKTFRYYHTQMQFTLQQRDSLDEDIEQLAQLPMLKPAVERLQCFRGISLHNAMVLATEIIDWRRFERPGQLASYLGLVVREDSSGDRQKRGSITKAGNSHCRHALIQAAWCYHHLPSINGSNKARQKGQPQSVIMHAWKAQQRLHKRYKHLAFRKEPKIAVVAVARELVGFLWAVMQEVQEVPAPVAA